MTSFVRAWLAREQRLEAHRAPTLNFNGDGHRSTKQRGQNGKIG
jgi:hypothetical protein